MNIFKTIRGRLLASIFLIHSILMGLIVYELVERQYQFMAKHLSENSYSIADLLASNAALPLQNNDLSTLEDLLENIRLLPDISMIFVMDTTGRIRASYPKGYLNQTLVDPISEEMIQKLKESDTEAYQQSHEGLNDTIRIIKLDNQRVGYCRILVRDSAMTRELNSLIQSGVTFTVLAIIIGVLLAWIIIRKMTYRMTQLAEAATQLTHNNFEVKIPKAQGEDEISAMEHGFHVMADSIKKYMSSLDHRANHDELTELPNRRLFLDRLDQAIKHAHRYNHHVAVLFIDLDHFKEINDSLGHLVGDSLLIHVARLMQNHLRDVDTIARFGGDEFCLIVDSIDDIQRISDIAENLVEMLQDPVCIEKHELYVTSSIGISIYPADGDNPETLLRNADAAMYKAKTEGRNRFQFYTEDMTLRAYERVALEANLRRAIENREFYVCYQPQVDGISGKLIGMEALIRWEHPELGTIPPFKFIPLAVETGLIIQIDRFVMRTAMTQLKQWYDEGLNPGTLALNLTVKQLQQDDFIPMLKEMLIETRCLSEWIELELTEGEIMGNPEQAIKVLQQIHEIGIKLAIDDFGTGYSSLAYLKRLPVDKLKIDRSFISNLPDDEEDAMIVQAIITLSKSLRLSIIAEGVETIEQKEFLIGNGCPHIQGYFYGKPMRTESMLEMLKNEG